MHTFELEELQEENIKYPECKVKSAKKLHDIVSYEDDYDNYVVCTLPSLLTIIILLGGTYVLTYGGTTELVALCVLTGVALGIFLSGVWLKETLKKRHLKKSGRTLYDSALKSQARWLVEDLKEQLELRVFLGKLKAHGVDYSISWCADIEELWISFTEEGIMKHTYFEFYNHNVYYSGDDASIYCLSFEECDELYQELIAQLSLEDRKKVEEV